MIKPIKLCVGGVYANEDNSRRKILAINGNNTIKYKILEKNGRGPGAVGGEYVCAMITFSRWAHVVISDGKPAMGAARRAATAKAIRDSKRLRQSMA
ncbi:MAG: hypothetical protein WC343_05375 [Bacilli bacterium]|jgi:hypothetical protein